MSSRVAMTVAVSLLVACGDGRQEQTAAAITFLDTSEVARCANEARCGLIGYSERERCASLRRYHRSHRPALVDSVRAGRLDLDAAAAARCLDELARLPCQTVGNPASRGRSPCDFPFLPLVVEGGACTTDDECRVGRCITPGGNAARGCGGTCQVRPTCLSQAPLHGSTALYQRCTTDGECIGGTACRVRLYSAANGERLCIPVAGYREACSGTLPCETGLTCVEAAGQPSVCLCPTDIAPAPPSFEVIPFAAVDESCDARPCDADGWCGFNRRCEARLAEGEVCALDRKPCGRGLTCTQPGSPPPNGPSDAHCLPFLDGGEPCDPDDFTNLGRVSRCPADLVCDPRTLTCLARARTGDPCRLSCFAGTCSDGCGEDLYCRPSDPTLLERLFQPGSGTSGGTLPGTCLPRSVIGEECLPLPVSIGGSCFEGRCDVAGHVCVLDCGP